MIFIFVRSLDLIVLPYFFSRGASVSPRSQPGTACRLGQLCSQFSGDARTSEGRRD